MNHPNLVAWGLLILCIACIATAVMGIESSVKKRGNLRLQVMCVAVMALYLFVFIPVSLFAVAPHVWK